MSAAGRNVMKVITGSAIGAAVAAAVAKMATEDETPEAERVPFTEKAKATPDRLRERWEAAKQTGEAVEVETTAQLTELFRAKVNDPDALKPPRPPAR